MGYIWFVVYEPHGKHKSKIYKDTHTKKRKESEHNIKEVIISQGKIAN